MPPPRAPRAPHVQMLPPRAPRAPHARHVRRVSRSSAYHILAEYFTARADEPDAPDVSQVFGDDVVIRAVNYALDSLFGRAEGPLTKDVEKGSRRGNPERRSGTTQTGGANEREIP